MLRSDDTDAFSVLAHEAGRLVLQRRRSHTCRSKDAQFRVFNQRLA